MGMDVYGLKPSGEITPDFNVSWDKKQVEAYFTWQDNTKGAYFRANVWFWRPLWNYVVDNCGDILNKKDIIYGSSNDGHKISKTKSIKIAQRLNKLLKNGHTRRYENAYVKEMESLPLEECKICKGTGVRKGWEGWQSEIEWLSHHKNMKTDDGSISYEHAHRCNGCNGCSGKGKIKSFSCNYPFDRDSIEQFAEFCKFSGGFRIC